MYLGEVLSNEVTHLYEEVANASYMTVEDSSCLLKGVTTGQQQRRCTCTPARASNFSSNHARLGRAITKPALPPPLPL